MPIVCEVGNATSLSHYALWGDAKCFYVWENTDGAGKCSAWIKGEAIAFNALDDYFRKGDHQTFADMCAMLMLHHPFKSLPKGTPFDETWINNDGKKGK